MAASSMGQSMASYYNPSAAYGSLSAASMAAAAAAAQQSAAAMSAGLTGTAQVRFFALYSKNSLFFCLRFILTSCLNNFYFDCYTIRDDKSMKISSIYYKKKNKE